MSRKISIDAANALMNKQSFKRSNTQVIVYDSKTSRTANLELHGNVVAVLNGTNELVITTSGWETVTTKDRLNALPGVSIHQKDYQWYLNNLPWDGDWVEPSKIVLRAFNINEDAA